MKTVGSTSEVLARVDLDILTPDELQFRTARYELLTGLIRKGCYACLVSSDDYRGDGVFSRHLYPVEDATLSYEERGEIRLDALYDKTRLRPADLPHITDREVAVIANDKGRTSELFGDLQPWSKVIKDAGELKDFLYGKSEDEILVAKILESHGGAGVIIQPVRDFKDNAGLPDFPLLLQEFIESNYGVPGLVEGRHDVRVLILNGEVLGGSVRQPSEGGYLSNTHQGGSMRMLDVHELPKSLISFVRTIDRRLPQKPRLYAADFMFSQPLDKWYLIELNGSPGALPSAFGPVGGRFQEKLVDCLIELATH